MLLEITDLRWAPIQTEAWRGQSWGNTKHQTWKPPKKKKKPHRLISLRALKRTAYHGSFTRQLMVLNVNTYCRIVGRDGKKKNILVSMEWCVFLHSWVLLNVLINMPLFPCLNDNTILSISRKLKRSASFIGAMWERSLHPQTSYTLQHGEMGGVGHLLVGLLVTVLIVQCWFNRFQLTYGYDQNYDIMNIPS